jgi:hypothetical protein
MIFVAAALQVPLPMKRKSRKSAVDWTTNVDTCPSLVCHVKGLATFRTDALSPDFFFLQKHLITDVQCLPQAFRHFLAD